MVTKTCKRGHALGAGNTYRRSDGGLKCRSCTLARVRWRNMIQRCTTPGAPNYENYGARGIGVYEPWREFDAFYTHVGDAPAGKSLDRIDNDGDYEPGNVRWATAQEQTDNRRYDFNKIKTTCPAGHPYSGQNLYTRPDGSRECRACKARKARDWRTRRANSEGAL